jgi:hypothetical protein
MGWDGMAGFKNLDKLLTFMQNNASYSDLNLMYSTPSMYLSYVNAAQPALTVKTDDFFPYSDWEHAMWYCTALHATLCCHVGWGMCDVT